MNTQSNTPSKNSFKSKAVLVSALVAGLFSVVTAFQQPAAAPTSGADLQTVSISAKRMSAAEKIAFDLQENATQTVVISAKRLTAEQKLAMALEDKNAQQLAAHKAARPRNNG